MATVNIKFFRAEIIGGVTAVFGIDSSTPETFTSSGTSQATTYGAANDDILARIVSVGGDVWVTINDTPVAVTGQGTLILDGWPEVFKLRKNDKIAIIN